MSPLGFTYRCPICAAQKKVDVEIWEIYVVPSCDRCKGLMTNMGANLKPYNEESE